MYLVSNMADVPRIIVVSTDVPSGKHTKNYGKSPCLMGKSTISTGPFSMAFCMFTRPGIQLIILGYNRSEARPRNDWIADISLMFHQEEKK